MTIVDTAVWSLLLRRKPEDFNAREAQLTDELGFLIAEGRAGLLGVDRQELLSGMSDVAQFARLRAYLSAFADIPVATDDHERAAEYSNMCRRRGIQGSSVDFLVCAVAWRLDVPIFTTDGDFTDYARHLPITLHEVPSDVS